MRLVPFGLRIPAGGAEARQEMAARLEAELKEPQRADGRRTAEGPRFGADPSPVLATENGPLRVGMYPTRVFSPQGEELHVWTKLTRAPKRTPHNQAVQADPLNMALVNEKRLKPYLWMHKIMYRFQTMGSHCLYLPGDHQIPGFLRW